jgi:hypothetical protein
MWLDQAEGAVCEEAARAEGPRLFVKENIPLPLALKRIHRAMNSIFQAISPEQGPHCVRGLLLCDQGVLGATD